MNNNKKRYQNRQARIRAKIKSVSQHPRLSVFRSNNHIYVQIIDDQAHKTLVGLAEQKDVAGTKIERARALGQAVAKVALEKNIKAVVFDKGSYAYHGRVKALAEGAREGGLQF